MSVSHTTKSQDFVWYAFPATGDLGAVTYWYDLTTSAPATKAPGSADSATIYGADGTGTILTGSLTVASLTTSGPLTLEGHVAVTGDLAIGSSGLTLSDAATLAAASATASDALTVTGASRVAIKGVLTAEGTISVTGGSTLQAGGLTLQADTSGDLPAIIVGSTSAIEVGADGHAARGAITVDHGATLQLNGAGSFSTRLVDNGTVVAGAGDSLGPVSGSGVLRLGSNGPITLTGAVTGVSIAFTGDDSLYLGTPGNVTGTIRGFGGNDTIEVGSLVTALSYAPQGAGHGTLTLLDGKTLVSRLAFAGGYSSASFHLHLALTSGWPQPSYSSTILAVDPAASLGTQAPAPTAGDYSWSAAQGGAWSTASNWVDGTGAAATHAPGAIDAVAISSPALFSGVEQALTGTGKAASLAIQGQVLLLGRVSVGGALTIGGTGFWPGYLDLDQGASLSAASATVTAPLQVGGRSSLAIAGSLTLTGQTDLIAIGGGTIQADALAINQSVVMADATSVIEIGHAGAAHAGVLTIASDGLLSGLGIVQNAVVNNGDIAATGNTLPDFTDALQLASLSGTGTAEIASGAMLELNGSETGNAIIFRGSDASLFLNTGNSVSVGGTLEGLQAGDRIITDAHLTSVTYTAAANGSGGSLALLAGTTTVGTLQMQGSYTPASFSTADITLTSNTGATFTGSAITVASPGLGSPTLIGGTAGADYLSAWQDGAVLTGNGGADTFNLNGANETIRDTAAHLNGTSVDSSVAFTIDVTDLNPTIAAFEFDGTTLHLTDFKQILGINLANQGFSQTDFSLGADGRGGTLVNVAAPVVSGGGGVITTMLVAASPVVHVAS
jgi:hypothetical protein